MAVALPSFLDSMKCPICLDFAENAVETACCAHVYCEKCVEDFEGGDCPSCREPDLETRTSRSVRRMIGEIPVKCPNSCDETVTRATLESHEQLCPKREYQCPIAECDFSGLSAHLIDHAAREHPEELLSSFLKKIKVFRCPFEACNENDEMKQRDFINHLRDFHANENDDFQYAAPAFRCPLGECNDYILIGDARMSREDLNEHIFQDHARELQNKIFQPEEGPIKILNSEGINASMAQNGKFYCDREDGADTDGDEEKPVRRMSCTHENRLNCRACMKLDVAMRNLPYGSLVNGAGHVARPSFCNHDVKGSEYFATSFRTALCSYATCGKSPKFTCNMSFADGYQNVACSLKKPCKDCAHINFVYTIHYNRGGVKAEKNYYGYVWKKA